MCVLGSICVFSVVLIVRRVEGVVGRFLKGRVLESRIVWESVKSFSVFLIGFRGGWEGEGRVVEVL